MTDPLLPFYDRELEFIRRMGTEFAERYPKIASRLQMAPGGSQDPHVERMIQAFALMNARIRHKLDDDFPELAEAFLNILYPHYLAPFPSTSIVQFIPDRKHGELTTGYAIPSSTYLEVNRGNGDSCTYRTTYPVTLWPIELTAATFAARPFAAPSTAESARALAVLRIELATFSNAISLQTLRPESLRFHICLPQFQHAASLYELIMSRTVDVALARSPEDSAPVILGSASIKPVGFAADEGLLPYGPRSFYGYRLLTEYFAFPQKFLFFDLSGLTPANWDRFSNRAVIYVYFNLEHSELPRLVSAETLRIGCTPIVNLFPQRADPIPLTHRKTEYRVVPDARRQAALEIYSIDRVSASSSDGEEVVFAPFYSAGHSNGDTDPDKFWYAARRARTPDGENHSTGSDAYLTLVDLDFSPFVPADRTLHVETTCTNRELPIVPGFGGGRLPFQLPAGRGPIADVVCVSPLTQTRHPDLKRLVLWKLISHLSLNHLSLESRTASVNATREILKLYDVVASPDTRDMIESITDIRCRRSVARVGGAAGGLCRGIDVDVSIDEGKFTGGSAYLFASVLSHFFGLYVSINSFARVKVMTARLQEKGEAWTWPPRAGERQLL